MALHSETRAASPVARDRRSARARWSRRVPALGAFALFVGGLLVAVGLGGEAAAGVAVVAPWLAAAAAVLLAAWLLWRLRPWAIAFRGARTAGRGVGAAYAVARLQIVALPERAWSLVLWAEKFASRPREPWQPPAAFTRTRAALDRFVLRLDPVREWTDARWGAATAAALARAPVIADAALTAAARTLQAARRRAGRPAT